MFGTRSTGRHCRWAGSAEAGQAGAAFKLDKWSGSTACPLGRRERDPVVGRQMG